VIGRRSQKSLLSWALPVLSGLLLYLVLLARFSQLPDSEKGHASVWRIYRRAGEAILQGDLPYRDFFIEYPPSSLLAFLPPAVFTSTRLEYVTAFAYEMALALSVALALTAFVARRTWGSWVIPTVTFAAATIILDNVALSRYDAIVALTLAIAALCATLGGRYVVFAYASLGFGAAAKLVPTLATLPLALIRRGAIRGYAIFLGVLALFFAPALLFGRAAFVESFAYHAERGLQVETLAASILIKLGLVNDVREGYGSHNVLGPGVELATSLSLPITGVLLLITVLVMYRAYRLETLGAEQYSRYAAALILAFMLGSKVLSPQYLIWLLPLVPVSFGGLAGVGVSAVFLATFWITHQELIHYYDLVALRYPAPELLFTRNLLLVLLWVLLLILPARPYRRKA
jgi:hypothetical protein